MICFPLSLITGLCIVRDNGICYIRFRCMKKIQFNSSTRVYLGFQSIAADTGWVAHKIKLLKTRKKLIVWGGLTSLEEDQSVKALVELTTLLPMLYVRTEKVF